MCARWCTCMWCDLWMVVLLTIHTYPRFLIYDAELTLAEFALPIVLYSRLQLQLNYITTVPTCIERQQEDRNH